VILRARGRIRLSILSVPKPFNERIVKGYKMISATTLGQYDNIGGNSSFANHLFQYAALKIYAKEHNLVVNIPGDWVGRQLFEGGDDKPVSERPQKEKDFASSTDCIWTSGEKLDGYNLKGYFQYHTSVYAPHKEYFKKLFVPKPELRKLGDDFIKTLPSPLIGIHIRRGDYKRPPNRVAPIEWYINWLEENWERLGKPGVFIASDEPKDVLEELKKYSPVACNTDSEGLSVFLDHYILQYCDVLLTSNSTFSFTAAMLSNKGKEFYRPDYQKKTLVSFDPWDSDPILPFPHHIESAVRLHLGCGNMHLPGYVNIDCKKTPATDKICDIRELPYEDNSVDTIESYHVFEHIPVCLHANVDGRFGAKYAALIDTAKEWHRVLKPGGNLVIEMPDLDETFRQYLNADDKEKERLLIPVYGSFRGGDETDVHRWGANKPRLKYILERAGFREIKFTEAQDYHVKDCPCLRVEVVK
jgi:SAM-dependent methyltransferase